MAGKIAVVLSGGGSKGAFQVGVLDHLVRTKGLEIDHWVGVSTGSIQALGGAMDDIPGLVENWTTIRSHKDIYEKRLLGIASTLLGRKASLYKTGPIRERLSAFCATRKVKPGRSLIAGTVHLGNGAFAGKRLHEESDPAQIAKWIYASCAQPPFFDPLERSDGQWVDGGVRDVTPLSAAMDLKPSAIIVIQASPPPRDPPVSSGKRYDELFEIVERGTAILVSEVARTDVERAELINHLLKARAAQAQALAAAGVSGAAAQAVLAPLDAHLARFNHVPVLLIAPPHPTDPATEVKNGMEFDPDKIKAAIAKGRETAAARWGDVRSLLIEAGLPDPGA